MAARGLVLFDIDGTLLKGSGPQHRQALIDAVKEVTGLRTTTEGILLHGMLDQEILRRMMVAAGGEEAAIEAALGEVMRRAERLYVTRGGPELGHAVCPGARELLDRLRAAAIPLAIVSGNITGIGWEKLRRAGLREYFAWGAFADMGATRSELAELAVREARRRGYRVEGARVSLIGDSVNDILAARNNGLQAVGVATGMHTAEQLREAGADIVVEELGELSVEQLVSERD